MSPVLSPSFWPPAPFGTPFRTPTGKDFLSQENLNPPPGFRPKPHNSRYSLQSPSGFGRSFFNYHGGLSGLGSPLPLPTPIQFDKTDNDQYHHRKAPGFDRPNALTDTQSDAYKNSTLSDKKIMAMKGNGLMGYT